MTQTKESPVFPRRFNLDFYMFTSFIPRADKEVQESNADDPAVTYRGATWLPETRTVMRLVELDASQLSEFADHSTVELYTKAHKYRKTFRPEIPALKAGVKADTVNMYCEMRTEPQMQHDFALIREYGITLRWVVSESHHLIDPYSVSITAADLEHCF